MPHHPVPTQSPAPAPQSTKIATLAATLAANLMAAAAAGVLTWMPPAQARTEHTQSTILTGQVIKVLDGDTLDVLTDDHQTHRIRLSGIDAPEKRQPYGHQAREALAQCAAGQNARVEALKQDRYQRTVGKVWVQGDDCGLQVLRQGLAWHYKAYEKEQSPVDRETYSRAEQEARDKRLGLWREEGAQAPWEFRRHTR